MAKIPASTEDDVHDQSEPLITKLKDDILSVLSDIWSIVGSIVVPAYTVSCVCFMMVCVAVCAAYMFVWKCYIACWIFTKIQHYVHIQPFHFLLWPVLELRNTMHAFVMSFPVKSTCNSRCASNEDSSDNDKQEQQHKQKHQ